MPPRPREPNPTLENPTRIRGHYRCTVMLPFRLHSPNSSLKRLSVAIPELRRAQRRVLECRASVELFASREWAAVWANFRRREREDDFGAWGVFRLVSRPLLGVTLRGLSGALRLGALLLSRFLPKQV